MSNICPRCGLTEAKGETVHTCTPDSAWLIAKAAVSDTVPDSRSPVFPGDVELLADIIATRLRPIIEAGNRMSKCALILDEDNWLSAIRQAKGGE